ncbi:UDP-N-acetylmuramoyl-tripeptide--D-alanyl-D-alanine ligase [Propionicicella superfundia]|uniref:UDP-N-acetylmuramoyl-tripeptide--D-alanyl-D- alanine ligase n=1 Tax=Propionicicella superfundia TaxID=348582 RepID=UPI00041A713C|nr:UDP-N-acetylmuramoyl-tripeptide--D-alanyl-D-alanine ligase [Propionicicella superfundia]
MDPTTLNELARAVAGEVMRGDPATAVGPDVVIDSRLATPGAVFIAFPGERVDGHEFVDAARAGGAAVAIVTRPVDAGIPQIRCGDAQEALSALARDVVGRARQGGLRTVALTGSSGKTSTKDLIAQVLEAAGPTVAPVGSFNNEIGVPLTACRVTARTRYLVSEMGARGHGHIAWLCGIVPPGIAAVLNVGTAHLGEFGSIDDIAAAKGEIVEAVPAGGWAVLNAADPRVAAMASRTRARIAWFSADGRPGLPGDVQVWASGIEVDALARPRFTLHVADGGAERAAPVALRVLGRHAVANALAAAAVGIAAGLDPADIAGTLSSAGPRSRWRLELTERADGVAVLNDTYNANPDSMRAGLEALRDLGVARRRAHPGARLVAVLGEMRELGPGAAAAHAAVGRMAAEAGVDRLVCLGPFATDLAAGARSADPPVATVDQAEDKSTVAALLAPYLRTGDAVLVKASRGAELDTVAADLLKGGGGECSQS